MVLCYWVSVPSVLAIVYGETKLLSCKFRVCLPSVPRFLMPHVGSLFFSKGGLKSPESHFVVVAFNGSEFLMPCVDGVLALAASYMVCLDNPRVVFYSPGPGFTGFIYSWTVLFAMTLLCNENLFALCDVILLSCNAFYNE